MKSLIVNFCAGPGAGKSTMAAHVFAELKWLNVSCELVTEYAKEKVWEKSFHVLNNQRFIYAQQYHGILRAAENVDIVITDSPLILSVVYAKPNDDAFINLIVDDFKKFWNITFFLERTKAFCQTGRIHNEEQAREIDKKIIETLEKYKILYSMINGSRDNVSGIVQNIKNVSEHLRKTNEKMENKE